MWQPTLHYRRYKMVMNCIFHLYKAMAVQVIQSHKVCKTTSVQAVERYQSDQCTETYRKLVNKYNSEDWTERFEHKHLYRAGHLPKGLIWSPVINENFFAHAERPYFGIASVFTQKSQYVLIHLLWSPLYLLSMVYLAFVFICSLLLKHFMVRQHGGQGRRVYQ